MVGIDSDRPYRPGNRATYGLTGLTPTGKSKVQTFRAARAVGVSCRDGSSLLRADGCTPLQSVRRPATDSHARETMLTRSFDQQRSSDGTISTDNYAFSGHNEACSTPLPKAGTETDAGRQGVHDG